jgi:hypothetical protein
MKDELPDIRLEKGLAQIVFYSKGWFKQNDLIDDLKILISHRTGLKKEFITFSLIYRHLLQIIEICCPYKYYDILKDLFNYTPDGTIDEEAIIRNFMGKISILPVRKGNKLILDLGEPDYTWLSKRMEE